jgi:hypothetical protein
MRAGDGGGVPRGWAVGTRRRTTTSVDGEAQGAGTRADGTGVLLTLRRSSEVAPNRRRGGTGAGRQRRLGNGRRRR